MASEDAGAYHVVIENFHGTVADDPVRLDVSAAPNPPRLMILRKEAHPQLRIDGEVGGRYFLESQDALSYFQRG